VPSAARSAAPRVRPAGGPDQRAGTAVTIVIAAAALAAAAWAYILAGHGQSWRTDQQLPGGSPDPAACPAITIVIPARDEAAVLPLTLPTLLGQEYRGRLRAVLVDDESSDGTGAMAADLGKAAGWAVAQRADGGPDADPSVQDNPAEGSPAEGSLAGGSRAGGSRAGGSRAEGSRAERSRAEGSLADVAAGSAGSAAPGDGSLRPTAAGDRELLVVAGRPLPEGWAGKVWAMAQGAAAAGDAEYLLFTDADIAYAPGSVAALAQAASAGQLGLLSQMALLRVQAPAERVLVK
jgi:glycosyltransferase involved in cell wall biosynthesis